MAHNLKVVSSNLAPTNDLKPRKLLGFVFLLVFTSFLRTLFFAVDMRMMTTNHHQQG
jgi:hypothetical protein